VAKAEKKVGGEAIEHHVENYEVWHFGWFSFVIAVLGG